MRKDLELLEIFLRNLKRQWLKNKVQFYNYNKDKRFSLDIIQAF